MSLAARASVTALAVMVVTFPTRGFRLAPEADKADRS